jgi:hypothetical protein
MTTENRLWAPLTMTIVNAFIGVFFLLALVPAVFALDARGYGRFSAVIH